jgi:hypothetical protein
MAFTKSAKMVHVYSSCYYINHFELATALCSKCGADKCVNIRAA